MVTVAAAMAVVFAAPAHADPEQDFLNTLQTFGDFSMGPWDNNFVFLPKGHQVCADLQSGVSPQRAADAVRNNSLVPWTDLEAQQLVSAAQMTLCPDVRNGHWPIFYRCDNPQQMLSAVFYNDVPPAMALLTWAGDQAIVYQQPMASGISYSGNGVQYDEHQGQVHVDFRGTQLNCTKT
jgi:hypothetical protein